MTLEEEFMREIRESFLVEAGELLENVEGEFLALERDPSNKEILDRIFNLAHNFKGSGKAVGFEELSQFSHQVENLLVAVKRGEVSPTSEIVTLLLMCCDRLKIDVLALRENHEALLDHGFLISEITIALGGRNSGAGVVNEGVHSVAAEVHSREEAEQHGEITAQESDTIRVSTNPTHSKRAQSKDEYLKISTSKIEDLLNNLGEQVILQSALEHAKYDLEGNRELLVHTINQLTKLTFDLQQTALRFRMVNLHQLFGKLERAVRDAGMMTGKTVQFDVHGGEQELDKALVDALSDALTHMVRNSVDHGLESPEERALAGKDPTGVVTVKGYRQGGMFLLQISDDGKGLDPTRILSRAKERGILPHDAILSEAETFDLIFESGFSTKDEVSELSGRGVGMSVVKETILSLKGQYTIESVLGVGTTFTIKLPLTLAIFNGFIIRSEEEKYVVPSSDIREVVASSKLEIKAVGPSSFCIRLRDEVMPLYSLRGLLLQRERHGLLRDDLTDKTILVTKIGKRHAALLVDEVMTQQKVVHKNLGSEARSVRGAAGATILGDGTVAIILEVGSLVPASAQVQ